MTMNALKKGALYATAIATIGCHTEMGPGETRIVESQTQKYGLELTVTTPAQRWMCIDINRDGHYDIYMHTQWPYRSEELRVSAAGEKDARRLYPYIFSGDGVKGVMSNEEQSIVDRTCDEFRATRR
jgi:hypothetical protein